MRRSLSGVFWALALSLTVAAQASDEPAAPPQVHWQRSLDDALALCRATGRSLFIAVNTDAESASERIVAEVYRDPRFVEASRDFVCVIASPFRHTPRDHDGRGRRIVDPRFGAVTSGEAVALEPAVFERFLGGERIAPRHALVIDPLGVAEKRFDLYRLYDFEILIAALEEASAGTFRGPPGPELPLSLNMAAAPEERVAGWNALAAARSNHNRDVLERGLAVARGEPLSEALDALAAHGDAGSLDALRVVLARAALEGEQSRAKLVATARALDLGGALAFALWEQLLRLDARPGDPGLGREALLLPLLGELHGDLASSAPTPALPAPEVSAGTLRSFLLSYLGVGAIGPGLEQQSAERALARVLDDDELRAARTALAAEGGPFDGASLLRWAAEHRPAPRPPAPAEELRGEDELALALERLEREGGADPVLRRARGATALELARVRLAAGAGGADLLLVDALADLEAAVEAGADVETRLLAARAAFLLGRFGDQERLALAALAALARETPPKEPAHPNDWQALAPTTDLESEALRWLGDASARLLGQRAGGSAREEALGVLRGGRALSLAAVGTETDVVDWTSLASFYGALGRRREEYASYLEGLFRHPEDRDLRAGLRGAAIAVGRPELALEAARDVCAAYPESAASRWWLGYALYEDAGRLRLAQDADGALARLAEADDAFLESAEAEPDYAASVAGWRARVALSAGFAHGIANDRAAAADALVRALQLEPGVAFERDALDREALDLLDGALEWRASGPSSVDALALGERLAAADPDGAARWWTAVSDSALREALRAAGREAEEAQTAAWLATSVSAGRRAFELDGDDPAARHAHRQALVVTAERELERERRLERVAALLAEAAAVDGRPAPAAEAELEAWEALARELREELGEARPVTRPGR